MSSNLLDKFYDKYVYDADRGAGIESGHGFEDSKGVPGQGDFVGSGYLESLDPDRMSKHLDPDSKSL